MNILQVMVSFTPKWGGPVKSCYELSKYFLQRGNNVTIIASNFGFDRDYANSLVDAEIIPFDVAFRCGLFIVTQGMNRWLDKNITKYDVVHLHEFQSYQNNTTHKYAKKYDIPFVLQARGLAPKLMNDKILKRLYNKVWGYNILRDASYCLALTDIEKLEYEEMGVPKSKIRIVPNGINLSKYEYLPERGIFKKKYGIKEDEKIILYLGRVHEIKGINLLVEAASDIIKIVNNIKLVIVGPDDGNLNHLKRLAQALNINNNVIFTGPLYGNDKLEAFVDAEVFVLPSSYDAFPNVVLEAWACKKAVIVTDGCLISNFVERAGLVVKRNRQQLESAITKILLDDKLKGDLEFAGSNLVRKEFSIGNVCESILEIYNSAMSGEC